MAPTAAPWWQACATRAPFLVDDARAFWLTGTVGVRHARCSDVAPSDIGAAFLLATAVVAPGVRRRRRRTGRRAESAAAAPAARRRMARATTARPASAPASGAESRDAVTGRSSRGASSRRATCAEDPLPRPSGNLRDRQPRQLERSREGQHLQPDGSYSVDAIEDLNFVLRCRRTDAEKPIDIAAARLAVADLRSLRRQAAADRLRLPQPAEADEQPLQGPRDRHPDRGRHAQADRARSQQTLDRGGMGIGLYPVSEFVHIDVRSPPSYRWID